MQTCYNSWKFSSRDPQIIYSNSYDLNNFNKYPPHTDMNPPLKALYCFLTPSLSHQLTKSSTYSSLFSLSTSIFSPFSLSGLDTILPNTSYSTTKFLQS